MPETVTTYPTDAREPSLPKPVESHTSKIGASLAFLESVREEGTFPEEVKGIVTGDGVDVSIRFTHVLSDSEIQSIEGLGIEFMRLNDDIVHSGTIYVAKVPWNRIHDLARMETVIRMESVWKPAREAPAN